MSDSIMESLTKHYHSLTPSGKKLADHLFKYASETQYMSISSLAESCGVSEGSITRFCRGLGLSGYNDLKLALAKINQVTDLGEPYDSALPITSEDSLNTIFHKIHASNIVSLNETLDLLDEKAITEAVDLISAANRVYCFGHGGSTVMAMEAWARFSTADSRFIHISDSHMQTMAVALATPQDVILFFSYSGATKDMEDVMQIAQSRKIPVILITHFPTSRAAEFARVVLLCGYNESPLQSGSIAAKVGQMFLIECLFYGLCKKQPELSSAARASTAEAIAKKLL